MRSAAAALRGSPGERGAIFATNRVEWLAAALGLQAADMTVVPIYPASTADQAAYIVEHAEARILFVTADEVARVEARRDAYGRRPHLRPARRHAAPRRALRPVAGLRRQRGRGGGR